MPQTPQILAFAGSTRSESYNKMLVKVAAAGAEAAGGSVNLVDLRDYSMPLYDGDLEAAEGLPENAVKMRNLFLAADGFLIATPEYNGSISAVLKNTIDWVSRPQPDEPALAPFRGKVAALVATSPGMLGGLRGLVHARQILSNLNVLVIPEQRAVKQAGQAFDETGALRESSDQAGVEGIGARLSEVIARLAG